jgi:hypothetical protein
MMIVSCCIYRNRFSDKAHELIEKLLNIVLHYSDKFPFLIPISRISAGAAQQSAELREFSLEFPEEFKYLHQHFEKILNCSVNYLLVRIIRKTADSNSSISAGATRLPINQC